MPYILVQEHVTSTTRGEYQKFVTLDTSSCHMTDVPCLDHHLEFYWVCLGDRQTNLPQAEIDHLSCL